MKALQENLEIGFRKNRDLPIASTSNLSEGLIAKKKTKNKKNLEISTLTYELGNKVIRKQHTLRIYYTHCASFLPHISWLIS